MRPRFQNMTDSDTHFLCGLPTNFSEDDKRLFASYYLCDYQSHPPGHPDTLSKYLADGFSNFTADDFNVLDPMYAVNFAIFLTIEFLMFPKSGVYSYPTGCIP